VLVEGASKSEKGDLSKDRVQGRTDHNEIVHVEPGRRGLVGTILEVEVAAQQHSLTGVPPSLSRSTPNGTALAPLVAAG